MVISKKEMSLPLSLQPVMPAATSGNCRPLLNSHFHVTFGDQAFAVWHEILTRATFGP